MSRRDPDIYVRYKRHFGFATAASGVTSRSDLYSVTLASAVRITGDTIYDAKTIDQILGLVSKNGRIDHAQGEHDDLVISWLLSHWLMTQGKNLHYYGFNVAEIFSLVRQRSDMSLEERYQAQEEKFIKNSIQKALEEIAATNDPFIIERKESFIRQLQSSLREEDQEVFSIDELIAKAKEIRKRRISNQVNNYQGYNDRYSKMRDLTYTDRYSSMDSSFLR